MSTDASKQATTQRAITTNPVLDTHPSSLKELEPFCAAVLGDRIVDEGDVITGGGVSAAIDLGLHVVERLAGLDARSRIAAQMCYPWRWGG